jgi:hypothetical protein
MTSKKCIILYFTCPDFDQSKGYRGPGERKNRFGNFGNEKGISGKQQLEKDFELQEARHKLPAILLWRFILQFNYDPRFYKTDRRTSSNYF